MGGSTSTFCVLFHLIAKQKVYLPAKRINENLWEKKKKHKHPLLSFTTLQLGTIFAMLFCICDLQYLLGELRPHNW